MLWECSEYCSNRVSFMRVVRRKSPARQTKVVDESMCPSKTGSQGVGT